MILNADLAENEPDQLTAELLDWVDAANVSCGVHAGGPGKTQRALGMARDAGVSVGAHPGLGEHGGRGSRLPGVAEFGELLRRQIGEFRQLADHAGLAVGHVKLHGTLYHAVEDDERLADEFVRFLTTEVPGMAVFSLAGGGFAQRARAAGVRIIEEAFADRGYLTTGGLQPRGEPGAVLSEPELVVERIGAWRASGRMPCAGGGSVELTAQTLCVHADNPAAAAILRALRRGVIPW